MTVVINGSSGVNLDYSTGGRITGDFSNSTLASRVMFQTSTANGATRVGVLPNGTSTASEVSLFNNPDPTNAGYASLRINNSDFAITSGISGTGSYLATTFQTGGSERMRIDTSGNVGIGTSSPVSKVHAYGAGQLLTLESNADLSTSAGSSFLRFKGTNGNSGYIGFGGTANTLYVSNALSGPMIFETIGAERMRIDSSGNLLVGYTAKGGTSVTGHIAANAYATKAGIGAALGGNVFNIEWSSSSAKLWIDATNVGTISLTSDYRIKQNIETQSAPALERVMQLRPVTYQLKDYGTLYKVDGVAREGFIAHELQAVIPSAVEGEKDAEDQIQSLKLDALCSVLTKAIQEQQAIITQLQADVATLKGNA